MDNGKNNAKSLKLGKDDIICPSCNSVLTIPDEIKNEEFVQCVKCDAAVSNPFFHSGKFIICGICGINAELPKEIENDLTVKCSVCGEIIYNPHSGKYNPIAFHSSF